MQSRIDKITSPPTTHTTTTAIKANDALVSPAQPPVLDQDKELRQIKALDSLLKNKYTNTYPIPQSVRYPKSNPSHYNDIIKELEEAPTRTWSDALMKRIKGAIRFS